MTTQLERRATSAAYRVVTNEGEAQHRALSRLESIAGEDVAWDVWLSTNPDPELVKKATDQRRIEFMRRYSPLFMAIPRDMHFEIPVKVHPRLEV